MFNREIRQPLLVGAPPPGAQRSKCCTNAHAAAGVAHRRDKGAPSASATGWRGSPAGYWRQRGKAKTLEPESATKSRGCG
jgi:hypothetical protein